MGSPLLLLPSSEIFFSTSSSSSLAARIGDRRKFDDDRDVNFVRFGSGSGLAKDDGGWLLDLVELVLVLRFMWVKFDLFDEMLLR
ncbi:hypothetical protein LINPERHAP1_LOCUS5771 [Linum perenne]